MTRSVRRWLAAGVLDLGHGVMVRHDGALLRLEPGELALARRLCDAAGAEVPREALGPGAAAVVGALRGKVERMPARPEHVLSTVGGWRWAERPEPVEAPVFVGRERERARVREALGAGPVVVLGPAGVGKTALGAAVMAEWGVGPGDGLDGAGPAWLDDAEAHPEAVAAALGRRGPTLVTGRRVASAGGAPVVRLRGLADPEAAGLLGARLAAAGAAVPGAGALSVVVARVEGSPLGLEIAAALLRTRPVEAVVGGGVGLGGVIDAGWAALGPDGRALVGAVAEAGAVGLQAAEARLREEGARFWLGLAEAEAAGLVRLDGERVAVPRAVAERVRGRRAG